MWVDWGIQGRSSLVRKEVFDRFERSATSSARMCLPRSLPTSSPRRRGQRGARAAQRARTTLTLTSGDARSAARKALAGQHAQRRAIGAQPNCLDPLKNRRKTGTNHSPAAPAQNLCLRRRNPSSNPFGDPHSCRKTLIFGSAFQAPSGAAVERGKWGRARPSACRFLLDAVRSWVQFGLEPSCQGPWIVAVEHVTQTLSFILDGSLPCGPFLSISKREGSRSWIFYMTVAQGWMCPRSCDTRSHVASELAGRRADPGRWCSSGPVLDGPCPL